jgi:hypothetical protein
MDLAMAKAHRLKACATHELLLHGLPWRATGAPLPAELAVLLEGVPHGVSEGKAGLAGNQALPALRATH